MSTDRSKGVIESLISIDPYEFEKFVAELWERQGWNAEVTTESQDAGIDVIVRKTTPVEQTQVIQVKRNAPKNKVSSSKIQQYASLRHQVSDADTVIVLTTSDFSSHAEERASDLNVKLINGSDLLRIIQDVDAFDLVDRYTPQSDVSGTASKSESVEVEDVADKTDMVADEDEEMSTSEAIVAVIQGLIALGVVLLIVYMIVSILFL